MWDHEKEILALRNDIERTRAALPEDCSAMPEATCTEWSGRLPFLIDFGFIAEAYDLAECLLARLDALDRGGGDAATVCRIFIAHMDISRNRAVPDHLAFFRGLTASPYPLFRGHAHFALAISDIAQRNHERALGLLCRAEEEFRHAGEAVYALKMQLNRCMVERIRENHDLAEKLCEQAIAAGKTLGPRASAPVCALLSTMATLRLRKHKPYEAQRFAAEAARLANLLPLGKAGAFALFQYGKILRRTGARTRAIAQLEEAERRQRTVDPVAQVATLIELFQCYRDERQWENCFATLRRALRHHNIGIYWHDLQEALQEALHACAAIHDRELATAVLTEAHPLVTRHAPSPDAAAGLVRLLEEKHCAMTKRMAEFVPVWRGTESELWLDFGDCTVIHRRHGTFAGEITFLPDSALASVLRCLAESCEKGLPHLTLEQLGRGGPAQQKRIERALTALAGIVEVSPLAAHSRLIRFRSEATVLVRRAITAQPVRVVRRSPRHPL